MSKLLCLFAAVAASFGVASADSPKKSAALGVVLEMMQKTADKIIASEEKENATYKEFTWFCQDTEEEKGNAIEEGTVKIEGLKADINLWSTAVETTSGTVADLEVEIPEIEKRVEEAFATRKAEAAEHKTSKTEVESAVVALAKAIEELKASDRDHSFLQTSSLRKTVEAAVLLGGNLGLKSASKAAKAVNTDSSEMSSYDDVVETLEELEEQFRSQNQNADLAEAKAEAAFKLSDQSLKLDIKNKKKQLMQTKQLKASKEADIGRAKQELEETNSTLVDDERYLAEMKTMCQEKEATFLQRTAMRAEELDTIEEAKQVIQEAMVSKGTDTTAAVLTQFQSKSEQPREVPVEANIVQHSARPAALGFLQRHEERKTSLRHQSSQGRQLSVQQDVPELGDGRAKLVELLSRSAKKLHSSKLALLATKAREDPFKLVKQLIEGLITKLQDQASDAQSKKMYCDKQVGAAELARDEASGKVTDLNLALQKLEARRDELGQDITTLNESLSSLAKQLDESKSLRAEEAEEAKAEVEEAETASLAVEKAIQVISEFYSSSKDAEVTKTAAFLQQTPAEADAPDAGFKTGEAYKGEQGSSTGIIGTLESIRDDLKRSISETEQLEQNAIEEHKKLSRDIDISTAEKKKAKDIQSRFETEVLDQVSDTTTSLERQTSALKSALAQLAALEEECGIGASHDERKKAREEEMEALKGAIRVLDEMLTR